MSTVAFNPLFRRRLSLIHGRHTGVAFFPDFHNYCIGTGFPGFLTDMNCSALYHFQPEGEAA